MNNFEKIKNMTLDEMAKYLTKITANYCEYCPLQKKCENEDIYCRDSIKQWLQQESEGQDERG